MAAVYKAYQPGMDRYVALKILPQQLASDPQFVGRFEQEAKVIAVGPGKRNEDGKIVPVSVKKGDRILFGKYSGAEIKLEGEDHLIIREDDVLAILE